MKNNDNNNKDTENSLPGSQGPREMQPQNKNNNNNKKKTRIKKRIKKE